MPERVRSDRRVEAATNAGENRGKDTLHDNAGVQAADKMNDQSTRSDPPQRPNPLTRGMAMYPQTAATALPGLQAWFLFPFRAFQIWQDAWFRLLSR